MNKQDFIVEYMKLCEFYQLELVSEDPFCGLELQSLNDSNENKFQSIQTLLKEMEINKNDT
jgi:hypothetical protein